MIAAVVAGTDFGAYKSTDSGRTWTAANSGLSPGKRQPDYLWMPLIASGRLRPQDVTTRVVPWRDAAQAWLEPAIKLVVTRD